MDSFLVLFFSVFFLLVGYTQLLAHTLEYQEVVLKVTMQHTPGPKNFIMRLILGTGVEKFDNKVVLVVVTHGLQ